MDRDTSFACSQQPITSIYPDSDESNPHYHILFFKIQYVFTHTFTSLNEKLKKKTLKWNNPFEYLVFCKHNFFCIFYLKNSRQKKLSCPKRKTSNALERFAEYFDVLLKIFICLNNKQFWKNNCQLEAKFLNFQTWLFTSLILHNQKFSSATDYPRHSVQCLLSSR